MIFLDGYNIMYKLPELRGLLRAGKLEQAREHFLLQLRGLSLPQEYGQLEVVFDGEGPSSGISRIRGMRVRFSSKGQKADQLIRDLLSSREQQTNLVISSDHEVQSYARRHGATAVGAEWLRERIVKRQALPEPAEKPDEISQADLAEMLRLFGEEEPPQND
jgi:predicted RNA-binding protein with PIN domain